jgi:hypothetical protein
MELLIMQFPKPPLSLVSTALHYLSIKASLLDKVNADVYVCVMDIWDVVLIVQEFVHTGLHDTIMHNLLLQRRKNWGVR